MSGRERAIRSLHAQRPRRPALRLGGWLAIGLVAWAWVGSGVVHGAPWSARSRTNLTRFLEEVRPWPLQDRAWDWQIWWDWFQSSLGGAAPEALGRTLALSVAAAVLAGLGAWGLSLLAARNLSGPEPFAAGPRPPGAGVRLAHRALATTPRLLFLGARGIPEYMWAFLFLSLLGVGPWPAVLALAVHNGGVLGRLFAEVVETRNPGPARVLRATGASRRQIAVAAVMPTCRNRWLLYFFYRWETCVREATVLGLLGFVSLGWFIQEARAATRYDEMVGFVLLGSALILAGDLVSAAVRARLRE